MEQQKILGLKSFLKKHLNRNNIEKQALIGSQLSQPLLKRPGKKEKHLRNPRGAVDSKSEVWVDRGEVIPKLNTTFCC